MLVFISWSGTRSLYVAEALRPWLKDVMQVVDPWVSSEDIRQGARWSLEIARKLEEARFGIICLNRENLAEPWVLFEAGALAKTLDQSMVCPYLIDLKPTELKGPLVQFQAACAIESDTRGLVHSINKALGDKALPNEQVDRAFRKWWPELEAALRNIPEPRSPLPDLRSDRELLEEILDRARRTSLGAGPYGISPRWKDRLVELHSSLFDGPDVSYLLQKLDTLRSQKDPNTSFWSDERVRAQPDELDGRWSTRWSGGIAGDGWVTGIGRLQVYGDYVYVITHDGRADCLIATRRLSVNRLAGRYINLGMPSEILAWAGRVVTKNRIDGFWTQGRWDLRRKQAAK